jgi:hypothetical protein
MSSVFLISAVLSFFGGILALAVAVLRSFMDGYWTPARVGGALYFLFGIDSYSVRAIPWPEVQDVLLFVLAQPLWVSLFVLALLLAFLSKVTSAPSRGP